MSGPLQLDSWKYINLSSNDNIFKNSDQKRSSQRLWRMWVLLTYWKFSGKCSTLKSFGVQTNWPTPTHGGINGYTYYPYLLFGFHFFGEATVTSRKSSLILTVLKMLFSVLGSKAVLVSVQTYMQSLYLWRQSNIGYASQLTGWGEFCYRVNASQVQSYKSSRL